MTAPRRGSARAARLHSSDARATASQRQLVEALSRVVRTEGFRKASATRIAQEAGLSRSGFYEHFASVDELSLFVLDGLLSEATALDLRARAATGSAQRSLPQYAVEVLLTSILDNRELYQGILLSDRVGGVVVHAMNRFTQSTRSVVEAIRPEQSETELELHAAAIGGSVLGMVMHYLRTDDKRPAAELAREMISAMPQWMYPSSGAR
ncbi:TetR/AcrR family transcriptional regulator [Brachybacterium sp. Z12]|uniref:TetR/AcrR family transcriptional regulator n=1 Tax=Brachybacterium sp. Z12 TaxID=2759167 RepID=UPI00185FB386|nr:TetR/AcrR family transcriptional regulator [Brachybacterium sp. Z12]QNN82871.1 TetR/AcrR family transcriptional regulator [Brachybacterium sp. Z12]